MKPHKLFRQLLNPPRTLKERAIQGSIWVFIQRASSWLLWLARLIVLARLLTPEDFGLFGIAFLAMSSLETLSQTGFDSALIQKKEEIDSYLDTAWTIQLLRGALLALILFVSAPYLAAFFNEPSVTPLLRLLALSPLLRGGTNIGILYFQKELEFHKQIAFQLSGSVCDLAVAILSALWLRNVWALVLGTLAGHMLQTGVSYLIHSYRPRVRLEYAQVKALYHFGRWLHGSSVLLTIGMTAIQSLIGKMLGPTTLGFYQMAYRISVMPLTELNVIIQQVSFPTYAKLQDNFSKLQKGYWMVLRTTLFIALPFAGVMLLLLPSFVDILLGEQWTPITPIAQILLIWGVLSSIATTSIMLLQALGQPAIWTKLLAIWVVLLFMMLYPLTMTWGILGTSWAIVLSTFVVTILIVRSALQMLNDQIKSQLPIRQETND